MSEKVGPNVRKLQLHKMSLDAIPPGGGFAAGVAFLMDPKAVAEGAKRAAVWVRAAIDVVRGAAGENPWRDADDEAIAAELLRRVDEAHRKARKR